MVLNFYIKISLRAFLNPHEAHACNVCVFVCRDKKKHSIQKDARRDALQSPAAVAHLPAWREGEPFRFKGNTQTASHLSAAEGSKSRARAFLPRPPPGPKKRPFSSPQPAQGLQNFCPRPTRVPARVEAPTGGSRRPKWGPRRVWIGSRVPPRADAARSCAASIIHPRLQLSQSLTWVQTVQVLLRRSRPRVCVSAVPGGSRGPGFGPSVLVSVCEVLELAGRGGRRPLGPLAASFLSHAADLVRLGGSGLIESALTESAPSIH